MMAAHRDTGTRTPYTGGSGTDGDTRTRHTGTRGAGPRGRGGGDRAGDKHTWHRWRWRGPAGARGRAEGAPWRRPDHCGHLSVRVPAAPPRVRCVPVSPALSSWGSQSHIPRAWASGALRRGPSTQWEPLALRALPQEPRGCAGPGGAGGWSPAVAVLPSRKGEKPQPAPLVSHITACALHL